MRSKKIIIKTFKCMCMILSILWVAFQSSCVGTDIMTVAPERRIQLLKDTTQEGNWESFDVALKYQYVEKNDTIQLSVTGKAKQSYDQLAVFVTFVDAQGKILQTKNIFNSGYRAERSYGKSRKGTIEKTLELPPGTTAFAFESLSTPRRNRR